MIPNLFLHSKYELMNSNITFEKLIQKAKFLGTSHLGIVDRNTLGGTLAFQNACKGAGIKFIFGETITVKRKDEKFDLKIWVQNKTGWQNLLRINKAIKVDNDGFIEEHELYSRNSGLVICIPPDSVRNFSKPYFYKLKNYFKEIYFQLDTTKWTGNERDKEFLLNIQFYLKELHLICPPILGSDTFYLDKDESHIKKKLNSIAKISSEYSSTDQHFKTSYELQKSLSELFLPQDDRFINLWEESVSNAFKIAEKCSSFEIESGKLHLPKYKMNEEEKTKYSNSDSMFDQLVSQGLERIGKSNDQVYLDRIEYEKSVIDLGGYRDYFLITYDIIRFAKESRIPINYGRGSAASSLCLYCLNVTGIDPIKYNLPFDRFLNSTRVKKGLPDCDLDFSSKYHSNVKQYIIDKYGFNHVAFVGTYGLLKVKSALKEIAKFDGIPHKDINYITSLFPTKIVDEPTDLTSLIKYSIETPKLKQFIKERVSIINDTFIANDSIKTIGEHAAAVIIFPDQDENGNEMNVWDWVPCRKENDHLTTEFSGVELDYLGFLKEDILGLSQLDKVQEIFDLIEKNTGKKYELETIPFEDKKTFWMFQEGYTQDIFQFSGDGMTSFLIDLIPEKIDHLIAANALYRPGAMEVNGHTIYTKCKNGIQKPEYLWGMKNITEDTYGVLTYQEQVMRACVDLGNFSMSDADNIRKAIGKKDEKLLASFKEKFIQKVLEKGCPNDEAKKIWSTFEGFGQYAFNLSHAACYTLLGYATMYLKAHYPIEFYSIALQFANDDTKPKILSEMNRLGEVKVMPPDINQSNLTFTPDFKNNKVYWSLTSVKYVGEKAVEKIIEERNNKGKFFSLQDFLERIDKRSVNKRAITNLIIIGAFDQMCNIKYECDRIIILKEFLGEDIPKEFTNNNDILKSYWWTLKSKELTGLGFIDYKTIIPEGFEKKQLINPIKFNSEEERGKDVVLGAVITKITERQSKRGKFVTMEVEHNSDIVNFLIWNETYEKFKKDLKNSEGKIIFANGVIKYDNFKQTNGVQSFDKTKIVIL